MTRLTSHVTTFFPLWYTTAAFGKGRFESAPPLRVPSPKTRNDQPRTRSLSVCGHGDLHRHVLRREPVPRPAGDGRDRVARARDAGRAGGLRGSHGALQRGHG